MNTNRKDTTAGNKRDGSARHSLPHVSTERDPTAAVTANTSPKQSNGRPAVAFPLKYNQMLVILVPATGPTNCRMALSHRMD